MKRLTLSLLAAVLCAGGAFGQAQASRMKKTDSAEELKQIEKDWVAAMKAKDPSKLGEILADNWVALRWDGRTVTKAEALAELKESGSSLEDIEMGPMDVRRPSARGPIGRCASCWRPGGHTRRSPRDQAIILLLFGNCRR